ncbi:hypothetical protein C4569_01060 [Candidatus Parcubacteria bacterium]|nr:MAG: hypothetical protein C4569_01060 [Candidatus Parcubacteria bacterium]
MEFDFKFKGKHHCHTAILMCVDFRFNSEILKFISDELKVAAYDLWAFPGAAKAITDEPARELFLAKLKAVGVDLHSMEEVIIVNHADCGAYGGRKAFSSLQEETAAHKKDLEEAKRLLESSIPGIKVRLVYADLDEETEKVFIDVV